MRYIVPVFIVYCMYNALLLSTAAKLTLLTAFDVE